MAADARKLEALMEPWVDELGFRLVRVVFRTAPGRGVIVELMAEREDGTMTIDDCADLSRALSDRLDAVDPMPGGYVFEVSSPGIERPLTRLEDFERFAGREAWIETAVAQDGQRRFRGRLDGVSDDGAILVTTGGRSRSFAFGDVVKARLVMADTLLEAGPGAGSRSRGRKAAGRPAAGREDKERSE